MNNSNLIWPFSPRKHQRIRSTHTDFVDARSLDLGVVLRYSWDTTTRKHHLAAYKDEQTYRVEHILLTLNGGFVESEQSTHLDSETAVKTFYRIRNEY